MLDLKSKFIVLEGPDGSGKTTLGDALVEHLKSLGHEVVRTFEPGGTPFSLECRRLALHGHQDDKPSQLTRLPLVFAGRYNHWEKVIKPALDRGAVVVCDRFNASTYAFQQVRELGHRDLFSMLMNAGNFYKYQTLFLDCSFEVKTARRQGICEDDVDSMFDDRQKFDQIRNDLKDFYEWYGKAGWSYINSDNLTTQEALEAAINAIQK